MVYGIEGDYILCCDSDEKYHINQVFKWISYPGFMIIPEDHLLERNIEGQDEVIELQ